MTLRCRSRLIAVIALSTTYVASAATLTVPGSSPTIQGAINLAANGDVVIVLAGTYIESIDFNGKNITVQSASGPSITTIVASGAMPVVQFHSGETGGATLKGFNITGGRPAFSAPYFGDGGGIFVEFSSPTIVGNVVHDNVACNGGGIAVEAGSPLIVNNVIQNNRGDCSQIPGFGTFFGGGISLHDGESAQIVNNVISGNAASAGGAIGMNGAKTPIIMGNTITRNTATSSFCPEGAGGIGSVNQSDANIVQNVIAYNVAGCSGGLGWVVSDGARGPYLLNNTIAFDHGAVVAEIAAEGFQAQTLVTNNIVIAEPGQTVVVRCRNLFSVVPTPPQFQNNDVFSQGGGAFSVACLASPGTNGNVSVDPGFVSSIIDDFRLLPTSPVIDLGLNTAANLPGTDFDGNPRIQAGRVGAPAIVDLGAFETSPALGIANAIPALSTLGILFLCLCLGAGGYLIIARSR